MSQKYKMEIETESATTSACGERPFRPPTPPMSTSTSFPPLWANPTTKKMAIRYGPNGEVNHINVGVLEDLEATFIEKRLEVVQEDGFLITPLHIVKKLAEKFNAPIHSEIYIFHQGEISDFRRVEIMIGRARGIGQAPAKGLACQLAAIDMMEKMKIYNQEEFPPYGLPPGLRINPRVLSHLNALCHVNGLQPPKIEVTESGKPFAERELYDSKSDNRFLAQRIAVRDMYNRISTEPYPDMPLAMGSECVGMVRLRELGLRPLMSAAKRDWLVQYRGLGNGKLVQHLEEEPEDGDFLDPEDVLPYVTECHIPDPNDFEM
ncbi:hypothetical protein Fcan01_21275 [Folsomia candida]|uniref:Uncharacterized protein n=1 Tax=Folsomia candida TaxID=158441 RepID=A0A226DEG3_FOLCA|nr:hypothetical protein Fcan01_21275 [Folsomia candida]